MRLKLWKGWDKNTSAFEEVFPKGYTQARAVLMREFRKLRIRFNTTAFYMVIVCQRNESIICCADTIGDARHDERDRGTSGT